MLYTHYVTGQPLGKLCAVWWPPAIYVARAKHTSKQRNAHVGMHARAGGVCLLGETPLLGHTSSIMWWWITMLLCYCGQPMFELNQQYMTWGLLYATQKSVFELLTEKVSRLNFLIALFVWINQTYTHTHMHNCMLKYPHPFRLTAVSGHTRMFLINDFITILVLWLYFTEQSH